MIEKRVLSEEDRAEISDSKQKIFILTTISVKVDSFPSIKCHNKRDMSNELKVKRKVTCSYKKSYENYIRSSHPL